MSSSIPAVSKSIWSSGRRGVIAAAVLLGALAACGGGGGGDDTGGAGLGSSGAPVSKADYVARADGICAEANRRVAELRSVPSASAQEEINKSRAGTAIYRDALTAIRSLPVPPGDEEVLAGTYDAFAAVLTAGEDVIRAAQRGDPAGATAIATKTRADLAEVNRRLAEYGMQECSKES